MTIMTTVLYVCVCVWQGAGTASLSLPLSPDQRSSSPADVSVGSSFPPPPSSSSDPAQCAGMEPELPVRDTCTFTNKKTRPRKVREG